MATRSRHGIRRSGSSPATARSSASRRSAQSFHAAARRQGWISRRADSTAARFRTPAARSPPGPAGPSARRPKIAAG
ncbi:hypothetical protein ACFPN0_16295 [Kitasatospora cinereorecta]